MVVTLTSKKLISLRRFGPGGRAMEAAKISQTILQNVSTKEEIKLETLWQDKQAAMEVSTLLPLLNSHNVRLVAVGFEELGLDDFIKGEFFTGDLYLDLQRESYKALGYKKFNVCSMICSLFTKAAWNAASKGRKEKTKSDFKGDSYQNGGLIIVRKGGQEVLLSYRQDNPADHVENSEILKALGIKENENLPPDTQSQPL